MPVVEIPDSPELGVPAGTKQAGQRVDFKIEQFELAIETKGYLLLWERSLECPCAPVSEQTEQPDPNCELCKGVGVMYFGANDAQILTEYKLTELQQAMLDSSGGMIVRGIINTVESKQTPYDITGKWVEGSANLTVRHENRLGYYDRITSLDSQIVYKETIVADGTSVLPTRYPVIGVNMLRSVSTTYTSGVEYAINDGVITWYEDMEPAEDTRLTIHYLCHPVWLIVQHPHAVRVTSNKFKTAEPSTPTGEAKQLPIQARIQYDFLPAPE